MKRYEEKYSNIKLYRNETNLGYIRNFEKVLSLCRGDYIALCDQDDLWDENKISTLLEYIKDSDLVYSDARLIDGEGKLLKESYSKYSGKKVTKQTFIDICVNNTVTGCTTLIKRSLLDKAFPFPDCIPHDHWLAILAAGGNGISYCNLQLISYRQHGKNAIGAVPFRNNTKVSREKQAMYISRMERYRTLEYIIDGKIKPDNLKEIHQLREYYSSFFDKKIRIIAFFFHLAHFSALSYRKKPLQALKNLFMSILGKPDRTPCAR